MVQWSLDLLHVGSTSLKTNTDQSLNREECSHYNNRVDFSMKQLVVVNNNKASFFLLLQISLSRCGRVLSTTPKDGVRDPHLSTLTKARFLTRVLSIQHKLEAEASKICKVYLIQS